VAQFITKRWRVKSGGRGRWALPPNKALTVGELKKDFADWGRQKSKGKLMDALWSIRRIRERRLLGRCYYRRYGRHLKGGPLNSEKRMKVPIVPGVSATCASRQKKGESGNLQVAPIRYGRRRGGILKRKRSVGRQGRQHRAVSNRPGFRDFTFLERLRGMRKS